MSYELNAPPCDAEAAFVVATKYWHVLDDGRVQCDVCPRACKLHEGQRGLCFVRACLGGAIVLTSYGRSSGFCVDPIEKKPLNHFLPGTPVLSFGTAGCNLACKFCQNWDISKSREIDTLADAATPERIAEVALLPRMRERRVHVQRSGRVSRVRRSTSRMRAVRAALQSVAVTAGYSARRRAPSSTRTWTPPTSTSRRSPERSTASICAGHLQPVLETLEYLKDETKVWFEITTLVIPDLNDSDDEFDAMTRWIIDRLGPDVPVHFTAFHPDWKMRDWWPTPPATLARAREIAIGNGIRYAYTGNVHDAEGEINPLLPVRRVPHRAGRIHHQGLAPHERWMLLALWDAVRRHIRERAGTVGVEAPAGADERRAMTRFRDRVDAGRQLATKLRFLAAEHPIVIALPRGGVTVGYEVANALAAPLDVWVVRKVGVPWQPELGVGAVAEGGYVYLSRTMLRETGLSEAGLASTIAAKRREVAERVTRFRGTHARPALRDRTVIIVDDGIATGGTVRAAVRSIRAEVPKAIVLAVPVAAPSSLEELAPEVDRVIALLTPPQLLAIGYWYDDFTQVSDDDVVRLLEQCRREYAAAEHVVA